MMPADADLMAAGAKRIERIGDAVLILGDCREIAPKLPRPDAIVSDPPFGTADLWNAPNVPKKRKWHLFGEGEIQRWDVACDLVTALPNMADTVILWGGQFYSLPVNRCWLVWNKIIRNFSTSVCELAWTNLDKPVDAFDYSHGQLASEGKEHPTQKPLPLMEWCLEQARVQAGAVVFDPYMGSGTTGVACLRRGVRFIGIEIEPRYFDVACRRIAEAARQPALFHPTPQPRAEQMALSYPVESME